MTIGRLSRRDILATRNFLNRRASYVGACTLRLRLGSSINGPFSRLIILSVHELHLHVTFRRKASNDRICDPNVLEVVCIFPTTTMIQPIRRRVLAQLHHTRVPQCRFYSSKPSSPADGANGDASAVRQALPTAASRSNRPSTRKNGNPNKSAPENNSNYPSVPSTHHIKSEGS